MEARRVAFEVLLRVERTKAYANFLLDAMLKRFPLPERDRALVTELVYGVLRWRGRLDRLIAEASSRPLKETPPDLLTILRLGSYQLLFLDRIPAYAAVDESVKLAARTGGPGVKAFVNAALRTIHRAGEKFLQRKPGEDELSYLASLYSHPRWLLPRWKARLGEEALSLLRANNEIPPVSLATNRLKASPEKVFGTLWDLAEQVEEGLWVPGFFRVKGASSLLTSDAFKAGWFFPMDEAAALPILLLDPQPGERILDACAGGGGKTTLMAALMKGEGKILALDTSERAMTRLQEALKRLLVRSAKPLLGDARNAHREIVGPVDRILVDAPCTGLGTLRRHPEIKWRVGLKDLERLQALQLQILEGVLPCLKVGGILVYSTCSTEPEENEGVVEAFLKRHRELVREDPAPFLPGKGEGLVGDGYLRTFPHRHGTDGFFAARLRRVR
ncbi:MAG: 16S rRNA (cytosine(967)-C(5))-methyltransferase RsmB [candidate division NC10 bacterium]|nr:16S rRNA (cytosine(967)-C(5))-methyltransferase RsmB [candidate division NC10 bacterium]